METMKMKTETEYSLKSVKFLLLTITTMFIIVAALMITLGVSVFSRYHDVSFLIDSVRAGSFLTPSILIVFIGFVMFIVSMFGFFGSIRESTCLVNLYALILSMVLVVELSIIIVSFTIESDAVHDYIRIPIDQYASDPEVQEEMDFLQTTLNCCGSESYLDYLHQELTSNHSTLLLSNYQVGQELITMLIPETCCREIGEISGTCRSVWVNGCQNAIANMVAQNSGVLGVLGMSVAFIQLLGIIFAILLGKCIRKAKSERLFLRWKVCEQIILARQAQEKSKEVQDDEPPTLYIEHPQSSRA